MVDGKMINDVRLDEFFTSVCPTPAPNMDRRRRRRHSRSVMQSPDKRRVGGGRPSISRVRQNVSMRYKLC